jgi:hypothetical protein
MWLVIWSHAVNKAGIQYSQSRVAKPLTAATPRFMGKSAEIEIRLKAVRWPKATMMFDSGEELETSFGN